MDKDLVARLRGLSCIPDHLLDEVWPDNVAKALRQAADAIERMEKLRQDGETITERYMQFASLHNDQEDYLIAKDYNARFARAKIDAAKGER